MQASLLCKALYGRLAVEPFDHLERVDGHEYPASERVDLIMAKRTLVLLRMEGSLRCANPVLSVNPTSPVAQGEGGGE